MIPNKKILELETRRQIYNVILDNPGLHLRELSRRTNLSFGGLRHHLHILKKQEFITTKSDCRYTRYYISNKIGRKDTELLNLLRQDIPRKIVLLLIAGGPAELYRDYTVYDLIDPDFCTITHSKKELTRLTTYWKKPYREQFHLQKHRTTLDFHLNKLLDAGIIEKVPSRNEIKYKVKDEFTIWLFLIKYKKTFSDKHIDLFLGWANTFVEKRLDNTMNVIFDIFPHPYHV